jgi:hypothetical protein
MSKVIQECIARMQENTARLQAASASLCATVERWQIVMTAKIEGKPLDTMSMRFALASETILPRWKRQPHSFHALASGEVVQFGGKTEHDAHSMRTLYMRPNYTLADISYLEQCVSASYVITAEHADVILRQQKPNTSHSKRRPAEADRDPDMRAEYRARPLRRMTAEDLARAQFTGKALERELRRIGRKP